MDLSGSTPSVPSIAQRPAPQANPLPLWKRSLDLSLCLIALPFLMVGTLVMAIVTRCVSPGPIFYRQVRIGYMGRPFKIFKFRTMTVSADTKVHLEYCRKLIDTNAPMAKLDVRGDARLIPFGWFLRASGLDELPQIINVLRGEMSIVGPRPCLPAEFEHFLPWQRGRCQAVPGLTGLWQVSGKNRTTFEEMIRLDLRYAHELSFWQDLRIILLTPRTLIQQIYETRIGKQLLFPKRPAAVAKLPSPHPLPALPRAVRSRSPFGTV